MVRGRLARMLAVLAAAAAAVLLAGAPTIAQVDPRGEGFLSSFPTNDTYRIVVVGDAMADQLAEGLAETLGEDGGAELLRETESILGLARETTPASFQRLVEKLSKERPHAIVVMLGMADRHPLREGGRRIAIDEPEWRTYYARRVDSLLRALRQSSAGVYWVGLPIVRRDDWNEDVQILNEVFRERSFGAGARYVDIHAGFADEEGAFNAYGPDVSGKRRLLRERDGVHFTAAGMRKLAHFVEREITRDIARARTERSIPLAGAAVEQARITAMRARSATSPTSWQAQTRSAPAAARAGSESVGGVAIGGSAGAGLEQRSDNGRVVLRTRHADGRVTEAAIEIVRPAIPAPVVALITRRESPDRPSRMGESVIDEIGDGIIIISSVTLATEGAAAGKRGGEVATAHAPYFRVLVKGERLPAKAGRVDDLPWPPAHLTQKIGAGSVPPR